jgi:predicted HicB family RNase H-like nuclease
MGRNRLETPTTTLSFRISTTVKAALAAIAWRQKSTVGSIVRKILEDHVSKNR